MPKTGRLRLFPLNTVLFPGAVLNLHVFEERYRRMIAECLDAGEAFGVVLIREGREAGDPEVSPHEVGTTAEIAEVTPLPAGRYYISTTGGKRFRIAEIVSREPYLLAEVEFIDEPRDEEGDAEARASELTDRVLQEFREYSRLLVAFSGHANEVDVPHDPVDASYVVGDALQVADALKQRLLELRTAEARLAAELGFLRRLLPQLRQLLERKRAQERVVREDAPGGEFRAHQEAFFGKHFSQN
ncbi:MAG: LON peptidase substrate-binding domain-containing protein [Candidatus Eremiobacteraeota bacterium]|nr:LON peptidase substrate-binding domain-containing protein [Candidatus Eremiobacteraeota bacterium]MBV9409897.1 LON peptidase substrate-binding domain-containing protein [Candidatus Eremiobacteraeota bacterium]